MSKIHTMIAAAVLIVTTGCSAGCQSVRQADIESALGAVEAAAVAAQESLPDDELAHSVARLLETAADGYRDIRWTDADGGDRGAMYADWIALAGRTIDAVIDILRAAGVDIPAAIDKAQEILSKIIK